MLNADMFPRFVGTAPGTTTFSFQGFGQAEPAMPPPAPFVNPTDSFPTQSVWEPDPNVDNVRMAMPPNQWVTGPLEMQIQVPKEVPTMGPVPNDAELASTRYYLPVHHGWINTNEGNIFTLQGKGGLGNLGQLSTAEKWAIAASVISALALGTTTVLAVIRYREEKRRRR